MFSYTKSSFLALESYFGVEISYTYSQMFVQHTPLLMQILFLDALYIPLMVQRKQTTANVKHYLDK